MFLLFAAAKLIPVVQPVRIWPKRAFYFIINQLLLLLKRNIFCEEVSYFLLCQIQNIPTFLWDLFCYNIIKINYTDLLKCDPLFWAIWKVFFLEGGKPERHFSYNELIFYYKK